MQGRTAVRPPPVRAHAPPYAITYRAARGGDAGAHSRAPAARQGPRAALCNDHRPKKPGIVANKKFYPFSRHFMDNRNINKHPDATDARIRFVLLHRAARGP